MAGDSATVAHSAQGETVVAGKAGGGEQVVAEVTTSAMSRAKHAVLQAAEEGRVGAVPGAAGAGPQVGSRRQAATAPGPAGAGPQVVAMKQQSEEASAAGLALPQADRERLAAMVTRAAGADAQAAASAVGHVLPQARRGRDTVTAPGPAGVGSHFAASAAGRTLLQVDRSVQTAATQGVVAFGAGRAMLQTNRPPLVAPDDPNCTNTLAQRSALCAFFKALNGPNWFDKSGVSGSGETEKGSCD